jgi:pimeloyl-ACP methyl ester carboxylesterase
VRPPGNYASANGLNLYYEIHGQGPPLLLLNGGTLSIEMFAPYVPLVAQEYRLIMVDQMGHGRTADLVNREFHYHDMAEDTIALMRLLEIEAANVVGFSDGGIIGIDMAIHHPERLTTLVVSGANFRSDAYDPKVWAWVMSMKPEDWPRSIRETYERLSPDGPSHWPIFFERLRHMWAAEPNYTREQMAGIRTPTLIVAGDQDVVTPEHSVEMFRSIPGAELCILAGAGHGGFPKEIVFAFLKKSLEPAAVQG